MPIKLTVDEYPIAIVALRRFQNEKKKTLSILKKARTKPSYIIQLRNEIDTIESLIGKIIMD